MLKLIAISLMISTTNLTLAGDTIQYKWGESEAQIPTDKDYNVPEGFYGRSDEMPSWSANSAEEKPSQTWEI